MIPRWFGTELIHEIIDEGAHLGRWSAVLGINGIDVVDLDRRMIQRKLQQLAAGERCGDQERGLIGNAVAVDGRGSNDVCPNRNGDRARPGGES